MNFLYPGFLLALLTIAIPIVIHLFNFRKFKKVYFSNVQFLKEAKEQNSSKEKLKHLLVLFSRILAISFLVFAFARPFIPLGNSASHSEKNAVSIHIAWMQLIRRGACLMRQKEKQKKL
jgi:L-asparagine transporter-like permease